MLGITLLVIAGLVWAAYKKELASDTTMMTRPMSTFIYGTRAHNYSVNLEGHSVTIWKKEEGHVYHLYGEGGDPDETSPKQGEFILMRLNGGGTGKYRVTKVNYYIESQKKWGATVHYEGKL